MSRIIGEALPSLPWRDRGNEPGAVWRYEGNPIVRGSQVPGIKTIYNSAAVPFENRFAGVFRCDTTSGMYTLYSGFSDDGFNWKISPEPIRFEGGLPFESGYDPRVCKVDGEYILTWCNSYEGCPTIGIAKTTDFVHFRMLENAFLPFNRNGVLFPRRINGQYVMLSRPSDNAHTRFGDIFLSHSNDLTYWGKHRLVMKTLPGGWQRMKIGAGPTPIETDEGWLLIYHGVMDTCNGFIYSFGAALLALDEPWKVIARNNACLLHPEMNYERVGDVPNVLFPCSCLADSATGRIAIYYGAADTCLGLAFTHIDAIIDHVRNN